MAKQQDRAREVRGVERRQQVMTLRAKGLTFQAIADQLGIKPPTAHTHFKNALAEINLETQDEARKLAVLRAESIHAELMNIANDPISDQRERIAAYNSALKANQQVIALLGIAAPEKVDLAVQSKDSALADNVKSKLLSIADARQKGMTH